MQTLFVYVTVYSSADQVHAMVFWNVVFVKKDMRLWPLCCHRNYEKRERYCSAGKKSFSFTDRQPTKARLLLKKRC